MLMKGEGYPPAALGSLLRPWERGCHPYQFCPSACQCQRGERGCLMTERKEGLAAPPKDLSRFLPCHHVGPSEPTLC